jgi:hypothetical protein
VAKYRALVTGFDCQFESSRAFVCDTDENAIVWAKQMAGLQPAELWSGKRLVERLCPSYENKRKERQLASSDRGDIAMAKLDERTISNMDFVLEETCRVFPHGGDHERRRFIARKLKHCARTGNVTLGELRTVAHSALKELTKQKSA